MGGRNRIAGICLAAVNGFIGERGRILVGLLGQEPISGVMTVPDYEPALTGSLTYEARDSAGAIVTVDTVTSVAINVVATVTHADGYSLTGAGGTVATTTDLTDALTRYLNALSAGSDVVLNHVIAQFFQVDGVVDVSSVTLNGSASNVVIAALETARIGTVTLS